VPTATTGSSGQPFGYTGEQRDGESGLVYLRARMYDPTIGRFLQRDPYPGGIGAPLSLNRYSYVQNNPVNLIDPSGLDPLKVNKVLQERYENECFWLNAERTGYLFNVACLDLPHQRVLWSLFQTPAGPRVISGIYFSSPEHPSANSESSIDLDKVPGHARRSREYEFFKVLASKGRIRYYSELRPSRTPGRVVGVRYVSEVEASTGKQVRFWQEAYDSSGNVVSVHPKKPVDLGHVFWR
jgi:RHS repeat-associated protein